MTALARAGVLLSGLGGLAFAACSDASGPADLAAPDLAIPGAGDSLPAQAMAFFHSLACPDGWSAYGPAAGRFVVPVPGGGSDGGTQAGTPLAAGDDRQHGHTVSASVTLTDTSFVGVAGCCNNGPTGSGTVGFSGAAANGSTGLPYVALLLCKKTAPANPAAVPLPPGLMIFTDGPDCPDGFSPTAATQGRHLVALPDGGTPGETFGGPPLARGEDRVHAHPVTGQVALTAAGVALASGCCAGGYGQSGAYPYAAPTSSDSAALPYLHLLQCTKN